MIARLIDKTGDVRTLLGVSQDASLPFNVSDQGWLETAVLKCLIFRNTALFNQKVNVNFVKCTFDRAAFQNIEAGNAHLWGAENHWTECSFRNVTIPQAVCPYNTFSRCIFDNLRLTGASAYKTKFEDCKFIKLHLEGFHAPADRFENQPLADFSNLQANVNFIRCEFFDGHFYKCKFSNVAFENCNFTKPNISFCDFTNTKAVPQTWWESYESRDPFVGFLYEVLEVIERNVGKTSKMHQKFDSYKNRYLSGEIASQDYSACLYEKDVSHKDRIAIERDLSRLEKKYNF